MNLRAKLIAIQMATAGLILVGCVAFMLVNNLWLAKDYIGSQMRSTAKLIGENSVSSLDFMDPASAEKVLESLSAEPDVVNAVLYDSRGNIFAKYTRPGFGEWSSLCPEAEATVYTGSFIQTSMRIKRGPETIGTVLIRSGMERYRKAAYLNLVIVLSTLGIGLLLAFLLSAFMQKTISGPVLKLVEATEQITQTGDYSYRVERQGPAEIDLLCGNFNEMIGRIESRDSSLRDYQNNLEKKVQVATRDLASANRELEEKAEALEAANRDLADALEGLKEIDRLKSEFLATMSHELRTPLNSIIGFTGILHQGMAGPINPVQAKQLGIVYQSAKHLLSLINDLLDLSRIEAGRVVLDIRPFVFQTVVGEALEVLRPLAEPKGVQIRSEMPSSPIPMVGDSKRCYQVLLNLVNNSIKFTDKGEVVIRVVVQGDRLRVEVRDTGIGIKKEQLGLLFEAFRQLDGSARRVYEGTGLGLHLCRKILSLMRGEIGVESQYGKGSCFWFTLPLELTPGEVP
jgi:signal transduction histidine kinase